MLFEICATRLTDRVLVLQRRSRLRGSSTRPLSARTRFCSSLIEQCLHRSRSISRAATISSMSRSPTSSVRQATRLRPHSTAEMWCQTSWSVCDLVLAGPHSCRHITDSRIILQVPPGPLKFIGALVFVSTDGYGVTAAALGALTPDQESELGLAGAASAVSASFAALLTSFAAAWMLRRTV